MVQTTQSDYLNTNGQVALKNWLDSYTANHDKTDSHIVKSACFLAELAGSETPCFSGISCLQQGLVMADNFVAFTSRR